MQILVFISLCKPSLSWFCMTDEDLCYLSGLLCGQFTESILLQLKFVQTGDGAHATPLFSINGDFADVQITRSCVPMCSSC